jgi:hypothetical protein
MLKFSTALILASIALGATPAAAAPAGRICLPTQQDRPNPLCPQPVVSVMGNYELVSR